jgi:hypothetical protein
VAANKSGFKNLKPGRKPVIKLQTKSGRKIQIVLLDETDSLALQKDGDGRAVFEKPSKISSLKLKTELLKPAGPAREISLSGGKSHIALAPGDSDFTNAAIWKISWPKKWRIDASTVLRIRYVGDVARLTLNGRLIEDNFYSGRTFDLGLSRYVGRILQGDELQLEILPLRQDAPIFIEPKNKPDFGANETVLKLLSAEVVNFGEVEVAR